jgi:hypothetical protein
VKSAFPLAVCFIKPLVEMHFTGGFLYSAASENALFTGGSLRKPPVKMHFSLAVSK